MTAGLQSDQQTPVLALAAASLLLAALALYGGLPATTEAFGGEASALLAWPDHDARETFRDPRGSLRPRAARRTAPAAALAPQGPRAFAGLSSSPLQDLADVVRSGGRAEVLVDLGVWVRHRPQAYGVLQVNRAGRQVVLRGKTGPLVMSLDEFRDAWRRTGYLARLSSR